MMTVIDIGTNTIRAVSFDGDCEKENYSVQSGILENTENGVLTKAGIDDLTEKLKYLAEKFSEKPHAFATSAFRNLENGEEVASHIEKTLGIHIDILSGEEEGECDAISLMRNTGVKTGIGADLGGGSCQIFSFEKAGLDCISLPLGVKRLKKQFALGVIPTDEERKSIKEYVKSSINFPGNANTLYIMGGTARAMLKLMKTFSESMGKRFSTDELKSVADFAFDANSLSAIKQILPNRFDRIGIGIDVVCLIAESIGAEEVEIAECSVREGYIIEKLQKNP